MNFAEIITLISEAKRPLTRADIFQYATSMSEIRNEVPDTLDELEAKLQQMFDSKQLISKSHPYIKDIRHEAPLGEVVISIDLGPEAHGQIGPLHRVAYSRKSSVSRDDSSGVVRHRR